ERLREDRDQLFAEAVNLYHAGVPWWPERDFELGKIVPEQLARYEGDPWEEAVRQFLEGRSRVTISEVAKDGLRMDTPCSGKTEQNRIAASLIIFGWVRGKRGDQGQRYWEPALTH